MANKVVLKVDTSSAGSDKILSTILYVKGVQKVEIDYKGNYPLYTVTGGFSVADLVKALESKSKFISVESVEELKKKEEKIEEKKKEEKIEEKKKEEKIEEKKKEEKKEEKKKEENQIVLKADSDGWISFPKHFSGIPKDTSLFFKIENLYLCNHKH